MEATLKHFFILLFAGALLSSCEETIHPDLEDAEPLLVVDAWLNNKVEDQVIRLTMSQPYLENILPPGVTGATVTLDYEGGFVTFAEDPNDPGTYRWSPSLPDVETVFGMIGNEYTLTVIANGETFKATSTLNRVPSIDSITFTFEESSPFYAENSYTAEFWATDIPGKGDTYWIKGYKNGMLLNKPSELLVAYDAGFSAGGNFDGVTFLPPLRGVNPNDVDEDDQPLSPYQPGDSLYVEIHSITQEAFTFLNEVVIQTNRPGGFAELFSTPLANVPTNIYNVDAAGSKAVGFFNVAAVSGAGKKLE